MNRTTHDDKMDALIASRGNVSRAARMLGITRQAMYLCIRESELLQAVIDEQRETRTDRAEEVIDDEVEGGNWKAAAWYLRTMGRNRGYSTRQEIEDNRPGQGAVIIYDPKGPKPSDEELDKLAPNAGVRILLPDNGRGGLGQ